MSEPKKTLIEAWLETHRALVGAFDTPLARRDDSECAQDARQRLAEFHQRMEAFALAMLGAGVEYDALVAETKEKIRAAA